MAIFGTLGEADLSAVSASISDTAVDVFVYDTTKDSDGGAWRKRTQNTSWYNETLGTATRGSRKEFPAVAVIVVEALKVTIYDGDDPDLPMWMVFNAISSGGVVTAAVTDNLTTTSYAMFWVGALRATSAKNGIISVVNSNYVGTQIKFVSDDLISMNGSFGNFPSSLAKYSLPVSGRNSPGVYKIFSGGLLAGSQNDVAMTVLPNAPIDDATGLPVPTIAVGTDGGASIIRDDGTVADITITTGSNFDVEHIDFTDDNRVVILWNAGAGEITIDEIPSADISANYPINLPGSYYNDHSPGSYSPLYLTEGPSLSNRIPTAIQQFRAVGTTAALSLFDENKESEEDGMVAFISSSYNTGYQQGRIKGAFLSDTDDTDKTNGQTDPDRSANNNALTVNGTITKSAVATGAELVAYSGWSTSNYLEQPINNDMNVGTGDFYVMGWIYPTSNTTGYVWEYAAPSNNSGYTEMFYHDSGELRFYIEGGTGAVKSVSLNVWQHFVCLRRSGQIYVYVNGDSSSPVSDTASLDNTSAKLRIGIRAYAVAGPFYGKIALVRMGASAPSPEQIKKIYEDEKVLFQENAKCTLYGSSDAVTALAFDEVTDQLHVGTSAGRSDFQGLHRINNTTDPVTTAISAHDSLIIEQ